jgi:hypothetical protein
VFVLAPACCKQRVLLLLGGCVWYSQTAAATWRPKCPPSVVILPAVRMQRPVFAVMHCLLGCCVCAYYSLLQTAGFVAVRWLCMVQADSSGDMEIKVPTICGESTCCQDAAAAVCQHAVVPWLLLSLLWFVTCAACCKQRSLALFGGCVRYRCVWYRQTRGLEYPPSSLTVHKGKKQHYHLPCRM